MAGSETTSRWIDFDIYSLSTCTRYTSAQMNPILIPSHRVSSNVALNVFYWSKAVNVTRSNCVCGNDSGSNEGFLVKVLKNIAKGL